jgi:ATP-dependent exoDNAse (exonuclease V) beta subunit
MDAAIESLTSLTHDPDLVADAAKAVGGEQLDVLEFSYRSRPELVNVTSDIFAKAFAAHGMPETRTRLKPKLEVEPEGLGPVFEHWPFNLPNGKNEITRSEALATGIVDLVAREPSVRDRATKAVREAGPGDIAVLCRTNKQCRQVAEALGKLGVPAVVPRIGLLDQAESQLALCGLRLWVDPQDRLAMAEIARALSHAEDLDGLVARVLEKPYKLVFAEEPAIVRLLAARKRSPDLGPIGALDAVLAALELPQLCAEWGSTAQRRANLDALRAHAMGYVGESEARRDAATLVGLLGYLDELADEWGWEKSRTDGQALLGGEDAVTVSTWHRAKGLEWPIVVLYGLQKKFAPRADGVHVMGDRKTFDVTNPLADRWIRYWPNPYTNAGQNGAVKQAYLASDVYANLVEKADREELRVLYVGWTRARDRLIFAAQKDKLFDGILKKLTAIDPGLMTTPVKGVLAKWAGRDVAVDVHEYQPAEPVDSTLRPGAMWVAAGPAEHSPAVIRPSSIHAEGDVGEVIEIGPRMKLVGSPDMADLGQAVHGFLAADRVDRERSERLAMARGLLGRWGVEANLDAAELLGASERLHGWIDKTWPGAVRRTEWPAEHRHVGGSLLRGIVDLVLEVKDGFVVIDHKSFPGGRDAAVKKVAGFVGQLAAYAEVIEDAICANCAGRFIHLPLSGIVIECNVDESGAQGLLSRC